MHDEEYAGFWIRVGATLIDCIVMFIVIGIPLTFIYGSEYWIDEQLLKGFWDLVLGYILPVVATILFWRHYLGTPGKMATNLRVVDAKTGYRLSLSQAIARYFGYIISILPLGLGFIWIGLDKKKQGWHDKLAGTVVIRNNRKEPVKFDS